MSETEPDPVVDETVTIAVPAERVWRAIVDPEQRSGWWSYLRLDATNGGTFEEDWSDGEGRVRRTSGHVLDMIAGQLLRLSWADDDWPAPTEVELRLHSTSDGTLVRVRHTGWERLAASTTLAEQHREGWRMHLNNLRSYVVGTLP